MTTAAFDIRVKEEFSPEVIRPGYTSLTLYTHRDLPTQNKVVGDVAQVLPVMNSANPTKQDMSLILHKQKIGFFLWKPGKECLSHEFKFKKQVGTGEHRRWVPAESVYGCKWCRERQLTNGSEGEAALETDSDVTVSEPSLTSEEEVSPALPPTAPKFKFPCPLCVDGGSDTEQGFKVHMGLKHSSTPKRSTRRKAGAGRRKK